MDFTIWTNLIFYAWDVFCTWSFVLVPLLVIFLPFVFYLSLVYLTFLYMTLCWHFFGSSGYKDAETWTNTLTLLSNVWVTFAKIWNGWEVEGLEHIPDGKKDGALVVLFHGTSPIDFSYLGSEVYLKKRRLANILAHRGTVNFPGIQIGLKALGIFAGPYGEFVRRLQEGHLVLVAPGGILEAFFSDENYQIIWNNRTGFARGAIEAKVPIIPAFTTNSNEAFKVILVFKDLNRYIFEKIGVVFGIPLGGYPVKMRTILGEPIPYDPNITPEELANKVADSMRALIAKHQRVPGSVLQGVLDRFRKHQLKKD